MADTVLARQNGVMQQSPSIPPPPVPHDSLGAEANPWDSHFSLAAHVGEDSLLAPVLEATNRESSADEMEMDPQLHSLSDIAAPLTLPRTSRSRTQSADQCQIEPQGPLIQGEVTLLDVSGSEESMFANLEDPEYETTAIGSFEWRFSTRFLNQTKFDHPVLSPTVEIGGHQWQIKLFPGVSGSAWLGIYLLCSDFFAEDNPFSNQPFKEQFIDTPLPLFCAEHFRAINRVPAEFRFVLDNHAAPATTFESSTTHAFSNKAPDRGFSRFWPRNSGDTRSSAIDQQKDASQYDSTCLKVNLRIVDDATHCLWERENADSGHENLTTTGLRGFRDDKGSTGSCLVAAVATWILLGPFRRILYLAQSHKTRHDAKAKPQKLIDAFTSILKESRQPLKSPVNLLDICSAVNWHGADIPDDTDTDVFRLWELLKDLLADELKSTNLASSLDDLFGCGDVRCKLSSPGTKSVQSGLNAMLNQVSDLEDLQTPKTLHFEIPRQKYDSSDRRWKIHNNGETHIEVNEELVFGSSGIRYLLYGVIGTQGEYRSGHFIPILRPDGHRWYKLNDRRTGDRIVQLTARSALKLAATCAYAAIYVRLDVAQEFDVLEPIISTKNGDERAGCAASAFANRSDNHERLPRTHGTDTQSNKLLQPLSIRRQFNGYAPRYFKLRGEADMALEPLDPQSEGTGVNSIIAPETVLLDVFHSSLFHAHEGPGVIDVFDPKWQTGKKRCSNFMIDTKATMDDLRREIIVYFQLAVQPKQCKIWGLDTSYRNFLHPRFLGHSGDKNWTIKKLLGTTPEGRIWLHVDQSNAEELAMIKNALSREASSDWDNDWSGEEKGYHLIYVLVKEFDVERQSLAGIASLMVDSSDEVEKTLLAGVLSELKAEDHFLLFLENSTRSLRKLDGALSFTQQGILSGDIIIVQRRQRCWLEPNQNTVSSYWNDIGRHINHEWDSRKFPRQFSKIPGKVLMNHFAGEYYAGEYSMAVPHGKGDRIYTDGAVYNGDFNCGLRHGQGRMVFPNGDTYDGQWQNDGMHGYGILVEYDSGNTYNGGFKNGRRFGSGTTYWKRAEGDGRICRVCFEEEVDAAFLPCGHVCSCLACSKQVLHCPICRKDVSKAIKLYFA